MARSGIWPLVHNQALGQKFEEEHEPSRPKSRRSSLVKGRMHVPLS